jgi:hypothetical protein
VGKSNPREASTTTAQLPNAMKSFRLNTAMTDLEAISSDLSLAIVIND